MNDQGMNVREADGPQGALEVLARETHTPVDVVHEIYDLEYAKLEQTARIKTFVSVLAHRHVKSILQAQRAAAE